MIVCDATATDICAVLARLREHCARELLLTRPAGHTVAHLAQQMDDMAPHAILRAALFPNVTRPAAAIFAAYRASPSVAMFQTFSTDAWPLVASPFIRWFNRSVVPRLRFAGIRVAEFNVLAETPPDLRWFGLMNCRPLGAALPRGRCGEPFLSMVWLPDPLGAAATVDTSEPGLVSTSP